mmetsp:Transcript_1251/g.2640  ORF Transcript_1251/g.2640 Transcript_1251/m.2640 type:complete len:89 (+) Transcript_1251:223-489(+)
MAPRVAMTTLEFQTWDTRELDIARTLPCFAGGQERARVLREGADILQLKGGEDGDVVDPFAFAVDPIGSLLESRGVNEYDSNLIRVPA